MKKIALIFTTGSILLLGACSPQMQKQLLSDAESIALQEAQNILTGQTGGAGSASVTQTDAASAIREALTNGINHGVTQVSASNGYFGNGVIKVLFPKESQNVETVLRGIGQGALIDKVVMQMNRSAEQAAPKATSIFIDAITKISISDAITLVKSDKQDACTTFLKAATNDALVGAFKPSIKTALDQTHTTQIWSDVMGVYNKVPLVTQVNTDLPGYVTQKAVDGLFFTISQEEAKIRKDPMGQVSELIKRVFGSLLGK